ncbi:hypothetical protein PHLGIDRAFT_511990 [Phlebiopsis gigantea 11061_1 CR5-6]|uniref:Enoyl reductase (ER) domain-containing protein n=1 Tax=Phlebiopsis gigantea (strain 11061_1 CR5-6) TaxID=745531 RepID=A0A0C3PVE9_PHLG1|nr:hypothetical protein PHLGIDRAFT_511990 [Phlebiopsis gigantea 11061_1 CR5-6]
MSTHTGVATTSVGVLEVVTLPTPTPGPDEVLVEARYAALIPFDGYQLNTGFALQPSDYPRVLGFAGSGTVKAGGSNVTDLEEGDRVATNNFPDTKNKAAQAFTLVPRYQVAKIPASLSLDQAATIPDNYTTAMYTVFGTPNLAFPVPSSLVSASAVPSRQAVDLSAPVLVYGAGASSGQYLVQAFRIAGCTTIFAVASSHHHDFLRTLGATACFDYRSPDVASQIRTAVASTAHGRIAVAVDVVASKASLTLLSAVLAAPPPGGGAPARLAILAPFKDGATVTNAPGSAMHFTFPAWLDALFADARAAVALLPVYTFRMHEDAFSREYIVPVLLPRLLALGAVRPNAVRLMQEGGILDRVRAGVELLSNNKVSGEKVVVDLRV